MQQSHLSPVPLPKSHRLLNHGPTVLVSASHEGVSNVMAAAWACALDLDPPKLTVVIDKATATRPLIEQSGRFVIQIPTVALLSATSAVGSRSLISDPNKLQHCGISLFDIDGRDMPFVQGCAAWLECKLIPEPHNQQVYDLFIGEIVGAWSDTRVFRDGHWAFESADSSLRSLHYVAGGHYYAIGEALPVQKDLS
ncbi:flavin reductase family protein [Bordetella sp. 15P40C-2]|uniref:flavin reductase family protein n=1 Tax=Bordetella sp. 15P40C-2 TaxID=2572246 RepID=UPI001329FFEE|nr:flavin reductase family protein [Bordetella sp. 15P40C-2]MVW72378.1 flavin reductase [Bordetella sp. 15P40C-2]